MLIEHAFITTHDAESAFRSADALLTAFGFKRMSVLDPSSESHACPSCGYDLRGLPATSACPECGARPVPIRRVEYMRGVKNARKAVYRVERQPQRVFVEFDRGRVTVAASIESHRKPAPIHSELLSMIASSVEQRINGTAESDALLRAWAELHVRIAAHNRRKRLPRDILLVILVLVSFTCLWSAVLSVMT